MLQTPRRWSALGRLDEEDDVLVLLTCAMEAIPAPAFVVDAKGVVHLANGAGRRLLTEAGPHTLAELARACRGDPTAPFSVVRTGSEAVRGRRLLVRRSTPGPNLAEVVESWRLSKRQRQILTLILEGHANASIADRLGIALRTVETHVTLLLDRAHVKSRSALMSRALGVKRASWVDIVDDDATSRG